MFRKALALLLQVMDAQKPQSSAIAEAIAAVQDAMAVLTVEGKALDDSDLRRLMHIKTSCDSGEGDPLKSPSNTHALALAYNQCIP